MNTNIDTNVDVSLYDWTISHDDTLTLCTCVYTMGIILEKRASKAFVKHQQNVLTNRKRESL